MSKNAYIIIVLTILLIGIFIGIFIYAFSVKSEPVSPNNNSLSVPSIMPLPTSGQPQMTLKPNTQYQAILNTTTGNITVSLFVDKTPITANNFIYLARKGFYNNTIFHRVLKGFMIQGGDPTGTGTGGPGYKFNDEPFSGEYTRGTLAMANAGPNTNGSQFFIMHQNYNLPKNYVIFGKVISGMDVVDKIAEAPVTTSDSGENSKPFTPAKIISVDIIENSLPVTTSAVAP